MLYLRATMTSKTYFITKRENYTKLFCLVSCTGLVIYVLLAFYSLQTGFSNLSRSRLGNIQYLRLSRYNKKYSNQNSKYILLWTLSKGDDIIHGDGRDLFVDNDCSFTNCYLTANKTLLHGDYTNFDALIFNVSVVRRWRRKDMPLKRNKRQKYIFYGMESSADNPVCDIRTDDFFNWTWSYKLNSDIVNPFIEVRRLDGQVVAPDTKVKWEEDSIFLSSGENILKSKAVAWIICECESALTKRIFVDNLARFLSMHHLELDIYGCDMKLCFPDKECMKSIKDYYNFYLVYEDSISDDYVTKEVLKAYNNDAIPIIIGGANYARFLPPNSYINAIGFSADKLAATVDYILRNPVVHRSYFFWKKHYTIHEFPLRRSICKLCEALNSDKFDESSVYENFRKWWYIDSLKDKCYPESAKNFTEPGNTKE